MNRIARLSSRIQSALRRDENGMEAAQVILILVIVVAIIALAINPIKNALVSQGSNVTACIAGSANCQSY